MAATKLQANWTAVTHGATSITRVTSVSIDVGGQLAVFAGDNDRYATVVANLMNSPRVSVTSGDEATLMGIAPGTDASFTATHKDAKLQTGGDVIYTVANAVSEGASAGGSHAAFGSATLNFQAYASDGQTNPISFTRA